MVETNYFSAQKSFFRGRPSTASRDQNPPVSRRGWGSLSVAEWGDGLPLEFDACVGGSWPWRGCHCVCVPGGDFVDGGSDFGNRRIRQVDFSTGAIETYGGIWDGPRARSSAAHTRGS
jgi:hypothetical protein